MKILDKILNRFKKPKHIKKLTIHDLEDGKYYSSYLNLESPVYYFKFNKLVGEDFISIYGFVIRKLNGKYEYLDYTNKILCLMDYYTITESCLEDIIDYLPNDNIDKKAFIRQKKINSLLGK